MRPFHVGSLFLLLLASCKDDGPSTPPGPQTTAAFSVAGAAVAGQAVAFDATASVDAAGSGLSYSWVFGDGARGGTATVAHPYTAAGSYTVQLVVRDAAGATSTASKVVNVAAGPAPSGTATVQGRVSLTDGTPLAGVTVAVEGATGSVTSAADGTLILAAVPTGVPAVLRLSRAGHLGQVVRLALPAGTTTGYFETSMVPLGPTVSLAAVENGGTATGPDGTRIVAPPAAFVDAAGTVLTGGVDITLTPIDLRTRAAAFPGEFAGILPNGQKTPIASLGVADITVTRAGAPVQVAPGKTVTVEIPIYLGSAAAGQVIPVWSLNEAAGTWVQEGTGTVVASAGSPTGIALRAEVAHFTPWNVDVPATPGTIRPHCLSAPATPLTVPCWVYVIAGSTSNPLLGGGVSLQPGQVGGAVAVPAGVTVTLVASAPGGLTGQSAPVAVPAGATVDVDIILTGGAPPVTLVAVGGNGSPTIMAFDGTSWSPAASPFSGPGGRGQAVAWNGALWVAGGFGAGGRIATSADGKIWLAATSATFLFNSVSGVAWNGSFWVAVGAGGGGGFAAATSPDGQAWTAATSAPPGAGEARFVAWNGAYWLAGTTSGLLRSNDGTAWTSVASPFGSGDVKAGAWNGSRWVVVGMTSVVATSLDGVSWSGQSVSVADVNAVAWNGTTWVIGGVNSSATSTNGMSWTVASPILGFIHDLAWTGTTWQAVGISMGKGQMMTSADGATWVAGLSPFPTNGIAVSARRPTYPPLP
jgi:PKD repeat protein